MRKNFTLLVFIGLTSQIFAQLNPINNLSWDQWYQTPHNFFYLNWEPPDSSLDTLVGYNIYRDNELYRFQTESQLYHTENGENCPENFLFYGNDNGFWMHVTAVYNSTNDESVYIDSVFSLGPMLGIEKIAFQKGKLFPNPTNGKLNIDYKTVKDIFLINQTGKILKEYKHESQIDLSDIPKGIYIIKVITEQGEFIDKIIIE